MPSLRHLTGAPQFVGKVAAAKSIIHTRRGVPIRPVVLIAVLLGRQIPPPQVDRFKYGRNAIASGKMAKAVRAVAKVAP